MICIIGLLNKIFIGKKMKKEKIIKVKDYELVSNSKKIDEKFERKLDNWSKEEIIDWISDYLSYEQKRRLLR